MIAAQKIAEPDRVLGVELQEFHPNCELILNGTTGWHVIKLGGQLKLFEVISTGEHYTLVNLNDGGRMELDNKNFYEIALNAQPPEPVKLPVKEREPMTRPPSPAQLIRERLESTAPSTREMDKAITQPERTNFLDMVEPTNDPKDYMA